MGDDVRLKYLETASTAFRPQDSNFVVHQAEVAGSYHVPEFISIEDVAAIRTRQTGRYSTSLDSVDDAASYEAILVNRGVFTNKLDADLLRKLCHRIESLVSILYNVEAVCVCTALVRRLKHLYLSSEERLRYI